MPSEGDISFKARSVLESVRSSLRQVSTSEKDSIPVQLSTLHLSQQLVSHGVALNIVPLAVFETESKKIEQQDRYVESDDRRLGRAERSTKQLIDSLRTLTRFNADRFELSVQKTTDMKERLCEAAKVEFLDEKAPPESPEHEVSGAKDHHAKPTRRKIHFKKDWGNVPENVDALHLQTVDQAIEEEEQQWEAKLQKRFNERIEL